MSTVILTQHPSTKSRVVFATCHRRTGYFGPAKGEQARETLELPDILALIHYPLYKDEEKIEFGKSVTSFLLQ